MNTNNNQNIIKNNDNLNDVDIELDIKFDRIYQIGVFGIQMHDDDDHIDKNDIKNET